ncbi:hypothetical protein GCM10011515_01480 [Tsuneonella deserti]|uniref:Phospholipase D-like domain-containing protein n=1 Tax=Tsuneonella deserti TaxID=2035528 RepID=A0ABQ1RZ01_9SPHN|nr:hypothetical protein [Tsuneonella deserti]GGD85515.1 hypothetical protein GCM10011515_01480 [Tsuneonella deserti]
MKYYDAFGEPGYHSAFLTTFAFSAQAFEDIPFSKLRGAGCRNVTVLADQRMLNLSLEEFGTPRFAGSLYHLAKVEVPGAFHPKIALLIGERTGRLLVGSANLTALGLAGNRELVADLVYTSEEPSFAPLFRQAFNYIASYAPPGDPWFPVARERALQLTPWLESNGTETGAPSREDLSLLLDRPGGSILDQVVTAIGDDEIERLVVMSPYWDQKLEGLKRLREVLGMPATDVLIEKSRGEFPAHSFESGVGIELYDVEEEGRGRFNHAKLLVALGRDWDHVVSGSVNCTVPALLGSRISKGNAEAAIYKRVRPGTALHLLGLEGHFESTLDPSSLAEPTKSAVVADGRAPAEPGVFQLRGSRMSWAPPLGMLERPRCAVACDSTGASPWNDLAIGGVQETSWHLDLALGRPRSARLQLADGSFSAVAMVIDIDVLFSSTLPPRSGRKAKLADQLSSATHEDLELVGILVELETIDLEEIGTSKTKFNKGGAKDDGDGVARPHPTLTYDDFVKARERAEAARHKSTFLPRGRGNRAADLVSSCLNRLIGLVSRDLSEEEDAEFQRIASQDPTNKEPTSLTGQGPGANRAVELPPRDERPARTRTRDYIAKIVEAVAAFEARAKALRGKPITTTELVRLRSLLQIILAYTEPLVESEEEHGILPVADKSGHDWPRLLGRLLMQHFGTFLALKDLRIEETENEQLRVLEYLATAYFASQAALQAVEIHPRADVLGKPIARLAAGIGQQVALVVGGHEHDREYLGLALEKLEDRFSKALGISRVPGLPTWTS